MRKQKTSFLQLTIIESKLQFFPIINEESRSSIIVYLYHTGTSKRTYRYLPVCTGTDLKFTLSCFPLTFQYLATCVQCQEYLNWQLVMCIFRSGSGSYLCSMSRLPVLAAGHVPVQVR
jgi:hypothetical protein